MKIEKNVKNYLKISLISVGIGILLTASLFYVFAATPSSTFYISSGVYPGAPSYTIWREGSNYFVKSSNGELSDGTNAGQIINNLITATTSEILLKAGTYEIDGTIVVDYPILFRGEGNKTLLRLGANVNLFNVTSSNAKFYDFYADGNEYEGNGFYTQSDSGIMNCIWQNLRLRRFGLAGIRMDPPSAGNCWILNNRITSCDHAIYFGSVSDCFIIGNDLGATTYNVIQLGGAHHLVEANRIYMGGYNWSGGLEYHAYAGIDIYLGSKMTIGGNQIVANGGSGIRLYNANHTTISGNYFNENNRAVVSKAGIILESSSMYNGITANTFLNEGGSASQSYGIYELSGDYNSFVGNNAWDQLIAGIIVTGANTKCHSCFNGTTWVT